MIMFHMFSSITNLEHALAWSTHLIIPLSHIAHICYDCLTWLLQLLQGPLSNKDAHEMMMLMSVPCYTYAQMQAKH
jgi:hypothetical protein